MTVPHIPVLRAGEPYESLDIKELPRPSDGEVVARISQSNAGIIKRDLRRIRERGEALRQVPVARLIEISAEAGRHFMESALPVGMGGETQTPEEYVATLSSTSGLPHVLCRRNMRKIFTVMDGMEGILRGLTRGMDPAIIEELSGEQDGVPVCYARTTDALGVVLPSNSPGVNSIWIPAIPLRIPVILKPGREEPWTPMRIIQAYLAAGCPKEAFSFYPTDHEGSAAILEHCGRSQLFGDESVTKAYSGNRGIEIHGPGRSKVLLGADVAEDWREYLDVMVSSVADNGGRSCINASTIMVPAHGAEIADALAERLASIEPRAPEAEDAVLSAFANPKFAEFIDQSIDTGLAGSGASDRTAEKRDGPRLRELGGARYLVPTVVHCNDIGHPLAKTEYLFPFCSVVELPADSMPEAMGPSLVVTAITRDRAWIDQILATGHVERLNVGPVPTSHVEWDQPHEGNLFEFLYNRLAIQRLEAW